MFRWEVVQRTSPIHAGCSGIQWEILFRQQKQPWIVWGETAASLNLWFMEIGKTEYVQVVWSYTAPSFKINSGHLAWTKGLWCTVPPCSVYNYWNPIFKNMCTELQSPICFSLSRLELILRAHPKPKIFWRLSTTDCQRFSSTPRQPNFHTLSVLSQYASNTATLSITSCLSKKEHRQKWKQVTNRTECLKQ